MNKLKWLFGDHMVELGANDDNVTDAKMTPFCDDYCYEYSIGILFVCVLYGMG